MINTFYSAVTIESAILLQTVTIHAPVYQTSTEHAPIYQTSTQSTSLTNVTITTNYDSYDL